VKFERFPDGVLATAKDRHGYELAQFAPTKRKARAALSTILRIQNASPDGRCPSDVDISVWRTWALSVGAQPSDDLATARGHIREELLALGWLPVTSEEMDTAMENLK